MGADNSVLKDCEWEEHVNGHDLDWDLQHAVTKDGRPVTVFQPKKNEGKYQEMLQQLSVTLKTLRHPNILRYVGCGTTREGSYVATERVLPLVTALDKQSPLEISAGIADILDALVFLHDKAGVAHNNICMRAVMVGKDGRWKIGELQHSSPFAAATPSFLEACRAYRDEAGLSPEEKQGQVVVKVGEGHTRDMFALGVLIEQIIEHFAEFGDLSKTFRQKLNSCLAVEPSARPRAMELRNDSLFQNDFICILHFLRNVAVKTKEEKSEFFSGLLPKLSALPEELVARRLAVLLLSRFVLLDEVASTRVIPHLLRPKPDPESCAAAVAEGMTPVLSRELFKKYVVPELENILTVHDTHIRLVLLAHFSHYCHLFDPEVVKTQVYPQVMLGLRDCNDAIVASTLRALADLVMLLGGDWVMGGSRQTIFFHGTPKFSREHSRDERPTNLVQSFTQKSLTSTNTSAPNIKPLLIDLISNGITRLPELEHEKKRQEKDKRREEAKQRKEERLRKLRLKQMEDNQIKTSNSDHSSSSLTVPEGTEDLEEDVAALEIDAAKSLDGPRKDDSKENDDKGRKADRGQPEDDKEEEGQMAASDSEEDWEDWNQNTHSKSLDAKDVLAESTLAQSQPDILIKKVPTSPDPYRFEPPSPVNERKLDSLQDVHSSVHSKLVTEIENVQVSAFSPSTAGPGHERNSAARPAAGKGLKLVCKDKKRGPATPGPRGGQWQKAEEDLGAGYDIKSIELSVVREEVDFFADMVPVIKAASLHPPLAMVESQAVVGLPLNQRTSIAMDKTTPPAKQYGSTSATFAMADTTVESESGGWGDADWATENF